eukprot:1491836-Amphidinium_carterae.1
MQTQTRTPNTNPNANLKSQQNFVLQRGPAGSGVKGTAPQRQPWLTSISGANPEVFIPTLLLLEYSKSLA